MIKRGEVVIANDPANDPRSGGLLPGHPPLWAFLGLPFSMGDRLLGMVGIANRPGGFAPGLVDDLAPLLNTCATLLHANAERDRRAHAESELLRHRDRLEETVRARTEHLREAIDEVKRFSYVVSHDLRAPLVNISGFSTELTKDIGRVRETLSPLLGELDDSGRESLRRLLEERIPEATGFIQAAAASMDRQTRALLEYSRLGSRRLSPQDLDLEHHVRNCLSNVAHQIETREAEVSVSPLPPLHSDPLAVEQIIGNLVDNAVKYLSPQRRGSVQVSGERDADGVVIHVADNGLGIPERERERIFQVFYRGTGAGVAEGAGMGLAQVQAQARRLGGRVWFESTPGEGSTFHVALPDLREDAGADTLDAGP